MREREAEREGGRFRVLLREGGREEWYGLGFKEVIRWSVLFDKVKQAHAKLHQEQDKKGGMR